MTIATAWLAQLNSGIKMRGGQSGLFPDDQNASVVPTQDLKIFSVAHNTYTHTYRVQTDTWYNNGVVFTPSYPLTYSLQDGTLLTVDKVGGALTLEQI